MTNLLVMTFPDVAGASEARETVRDLERRGLIKLEDTAVISRDASGATRVNNEVDRSIKIGAGVGAMVGLIFSFSFPLLGLAIGAGGGALTGKALDRGLDKSFIAEVEAALQPGTSALALVMNSADPTALRAALEPLAGAIYETTLDPSLEEELRRALQ
jgi:uncharacterized membrane protein